MSKAWVVHISDIHLGERIEGGHLLKNKVVPGLGAHDPRALLALGNFLRDFKNDPDKAGQPRALVISGDVTAAGSVSELSFYKTLRKRGIDVDDYLSIDALDDGYRVLDMPGNHDFWQGIPANGELNKSLRDLHFTGPRALTLTVGRTVLAFHTLCSTSDATHREQIMAVGAYSPKDLSQVKASIKKVHEQARGRGVHYIVTHHSLDAGTEFFHGVRESSRQDLATLCKELDTIKVQGLLTGHTHRCLLAGEPPRKEAHLPPEIRCASTLQNHAPRELLVHEFVETMDDRTGHPRLGWTVHVWKFNGRTRFVRTKTVPLN